MKTANFKYVGNPTGRKEETVSGKVTFKDDGKTSISIFSTNISYAAKFHAKELAKQIVAADFNHPAVSDLKETNSSKGLIGALLRETAELKAIFIETTKTYAETYFAHVSKLVKMTQQEWYEKYGVEYTVRANDGAVFPVSKEYNSKKLYKMRDVKSNAESIFSAGLEVFRAKEVKYAEMHYNNSITRLSSRLNQKGITDDSEFTITSAKVKMNFECYIHHAGGVTRAWTIIASGPIQRPHYRYLVK